MIRSSALLTTAAVLLAATVAGCTASSPSATPSPAEGPIRPARLARGRRTVPIVVDTDLAADDILAIMVLLRQPGVDLRAITVSGTGEVRCPAGLRNTRRLVAAFGRPEIPVACGRENPGPAGRWFPSAWRDGADAFYGVTLPAVDGESSRTGETAAELLARLATEAKTAGDPLTLVPLGPWTNLQDALALDPAFTANLAGIHAMGGTIDAPGNIDIETTSPSDMVEWNFGVDPEAVAAVLATDVPVTMVGLDATDHVPGPRRHRGDCSRPTPPPPARTSRTTCTCATRSSWRAARSGTRSRRSCSRTRRSRPGRTSRSAPRPPAGAPAARPATRPGASSGRR